ncbi:MAG: 1,6-anhydro-N-acetylmuramyl-L-alanine amidase AmpD [Gammaproteobacteria bacterium]|nr:1,6-anhydro-N-acetylmuramyl-L-alanine amidase AmpD [Gammaproteobacteria bacterium]
MSIRPLGALHQTGVPTISEGWLAGARRVPSPNCDARPPQQAARLLVIHGISLPPGEYGGPWIDALFTNRLDPQAHPYFAEIHQLRVSSHLLIRRTGEVVQYVPFDRRAWHAGASAYQGCACCNDFSIGIELEGTDAEPYEAVQYQRLAECVAALLAAYPELSPERIAGHSDIAPGRKSDPGPHFDWHHFHYLLQGQWLAKHQTSIDT